MLAAMDSEFDGVDSGPGGDLYEAFAPSGWYADPLGCGERCFWGGSSWAVHVATAGVVSRSPLKRESYFGLVVLLVALTQFLWWVSEPSVPDVF